MTGKLNIVGPLKYPSRLANVHGFDGKFTIVNAFNDSQVFIEYVPGSVASFTSRQKRGESLLREINNQDNRVEIQNVI